MKGVIGVLALQGDYQAHVAAFKNLAYETRLVKKATDCSEIAALAIPGGESSAMLRLLDEPLEQELVRQISQGLPTLATCAGIILLAKKVSQPEQRSLGLLDIAVERNSYGRQLESFITESLTLGEDAEAVEFNPKQLPLEGVFIRAPRITSYEPTVKVLARHHNDPVAILQENILGLSFHPELTNSHSTFHEFFIDKVMKDDLRR